MAGLIKNQILKHLSRFAKNLSSDKLQFSTLRGHCELHNLELNEQVLTDLLELPSFLQLTRAVCSHVIVKIHWTKLKSVPISVSLDEVVIEIETCEDIRPRPPTGRGSSSSTGKYGFSDRVIDGMTVVANSVCVEFKSPVFQASFQLSRLVLESRTPNWKKADLRSCRLKSGDTAEVLLFKYMEWQVLRIEAKAVEKEELPSVLKTTPLRLITNQAMCRITIKKKLTDCSVLGSRVVLVMDDLLWVLTDIQILAAIHFLRSLSDLVEASKKAKLILPPGQHSHETSKTTSKTSSQLSPISKLFTHCDVVEPSYHFISKRIDFHLCDDAKDGRSQHSSLQSGGALQISLGNLSFDYYPYNLYSKGREHWQRYSEPSSSRSSWVSDLLSSFQEQLVSTAAQADRMSASSSVRSSIILSDDGSDSKTSTSQAQQQQQRKPMVQTHWSQLMSSCMILRLEQYSIFKISTSQTSRKRKQQMFLYSKNSNLMLPDNMKAIHMEFTQYYFPSGVHLPSPPPHMFCHLGPLLLEVHQRTLFWLNAFMLNFKKCLEPLMPKQQVKPVLGVRIEALMPEIHIPSQDEAQGSSPEYPAGLQVLAARVVATNCRSSDAHSRNHLSHCLESFGQGTLLYSRDQFPWQEDDRHPIAQKFVDHAANKDHCDLFWEEGGITLNTDSRDVWSVHFDPIWMDFKYEGEGKKRLLPFMDPLPLTIWLTHKFEDPSLESKESLEADVYSLLHINSVVKLQTNHHQYLFLLHMFDEVLDLNLQVQKDTEQICGPTGLRTMCLCSVIPLVEFSLILNTETQHIVLSPSCTDSESIMQDDSPSPLDEMPRVDTPGVKPATPSNEEDQLDADGASIRDKSPACSNCSRNCVLPKSCSDSIIDSSIQAALTLDKQAEAIQKGYHTGTAVVKKGFSSFMASIDSIMAKTDHPTPDSDNASVCDEDSMSIRSDLSSDSEFVLTGMESNSWEDEMFKAHTEVEVANEVKEDTISNVTVSNSDLKRDVLSVMTAKVFCVEVVQQSLAQTGSRLLLQVSQVALSEYLAISWADFQNNFAAKSRGLKEFQEESSRLEWRVRARLCQGEGTPGSLQMHLRQLDLSLTKSLLPLLATTLQDDSAPKGMPTLIQVQELRLTLKTDFPMEEERCPLTFYIPGCVLEKTSKGLLQLISLTDSSKESGKTGDDSAIDAGDTFARFSSAESPTKTRIPTIACQSGSARHSHLNGDGPLSQTNGIPKSLSDGELKSSATVLQQTQEEVNSLKQENETLKKQLHFLRTVFAEDELKQRLVDALDDVHRLEDEKLQLSKTLKLLQGELTKFDVGK